MTLLGRLHLSHWAAHPYRLTVQSQREVGWMVGSCGTTHSGLAGAAARHSAADAPR